MPTDQPLTAGPLPSLPQQRPVPSCPDGYPGCAAGCWAMQLLRAAAAAGRLGGRSLRHPSSGPCTLAACTSAHAAFASAYTLSRHSFASARGPARGTPAAAGAGAPSVGGAWVSEPGCSVAAPWVKAGAGAAWPGGRVRLGAGFRACQCPGEGKGAACRGVRGAACSARRRQERRCAAAAATSCRRIAAPFLLGTRAATRCACALP